jgi:antitoxin YefM
MKTATVSDFRARMREHLEEVQKDQDVLLLSGPRNKDFVVITLDQYNSMEETAHLLSTPANTKRLMESIAQDQAGDVAKTFNLRKPRVGLAGQVGKKSGKKGSSNKSLQGPGMRSGSKKSNTARKVRK